jgi:hypothetical protein
VNCGGRHGSISGAKREPGIGTFPAKIKVLVGEMSCCWSVAAIKIMCFTSGFDRPSY